MSVFAQQGFEAFLAGKTREENPHENPHKRFRWESGWIDAELEIEFLSSHWKVSKKVAIKKLLTEGQPR